MSDARRKIDKWLRNDANIWPNRATMAELCAEWDAMYEALTQMLDEMGPEGHCVCEAAKQMAMRACATDGDERERTGHPCEIG